MSAVETISPPDYHTHTRLCKHARGIPAEYARSAVSNHVPELACTDHCPTPDQFDLEHRMELAEFDTYAGWVRDVQALGEPTVLFGVEADYYVGCTEFLSAWLSAQPLDLVLGSVHYLDYWAFDNPEQRSLWETADLRGVWQKYFELITEMVQTGLYDVAAHLDLPKKFGHRLPDNVLYELVLPVLDTISVSGMAIEINTSGLGKPIAEFFPSAEILAWACERKIPLTFGSDAHDPSVVGAEFDAAVIMARQAGYTHSLRFRGRRAEPIPLPAVAVSF